MKTDRSSASYTRHDQTSEDLSSIPCHQNKSFSPHPHVQLSKSRRKRRWIEEEEIYAKKLIDAFYKGYLKVTNGTKLQSLLAVRLCCDPSRIAKKFPDCTGKQVFSSNEGSLIDESERETIRKELAALERNFTAKIDCQHKMNYPLPMQTVQCKRHSNYIPTVDVSNTCQNTQHSAAPYNPRRVNSSADLFGKHCPTTIEQMICISSENLRKKLANENNIFSNGEINDAAKFCAATAHAYSEKTMIEEVPIRSNAPLVLNCIVKMDSKVLDLPLNFSEAAEYGSSSTRRHETCSSGSTSSCSENTSNPGVDEDGSATRFYDAFSASASRSDSSSSLSSDRTDNSSDGNLGNSNDEIDCKAVQLSKTIEKQKRRPSLDFMKNPCMPPIQPTQSDVADDFVMAKLPRLIY